MKNKKTVSKVIGVISTILYVILMAFLLLALIVNFNKKPNQINGVFGYSFAVVQSESMIPLFQVGDVVIIKQVDTDTLKVDDIIVFYESNNAQNVEEAKNNGNRLIIHRIIEIKEEDGVKYFNTKGDNPNNSPDGFTREDFVCAKYVQAGGFVEKVLQFVSSPTGLIVVIVLPVILTVILECCGITTDIKNTRIAEKLLTRKIKYSEIDKNKTKLAELLSNPEKVYLYDISFPEDKTNLAIVLWDDDVDEALIFYDQSREKYYKYFEEKFTKKEQKQLAFLKIKADLLKENPLLSEEDIDTKAKVIYNEQKEAKNNNAGNTNDNANDDKNTTNNTDK